MASIFLRRTEFENYKKFENLVNNLPIQNTKEFCIATAALKALQINKDPPLFAKKTQNKELKESILLLKKALNTVPKNM